jgi:hypothetical protein
VSAIWLFIFSAARWAWLSRAAALAFRKSSRRHALAGNFRPLRDNKRAANGRPFLIKANSTPVPDARRPWQFQAFPARA